MRKQLKKPGIDLPVYLDSIGRHWIQEDVFRPGGIPICHFLISEKNEGIVEIDEKKIILSEGQSLFINKHIPHNYHKTGKEWITAFFTFDGNSIQDMIRNFGIGKYVFLSSQETSKISMEVSYLLAVTERRTVQSEMLSSVSLYKILTVIAMASRNKEKISLDNSKVKTVKEYIDKNYRKIITNEDLALLSNYSVQHMSRLFKLIYGTTPVDYLRQIRLMKAKEFLITQKRLSVQQVAEMVGFDSGSYFIDIFKKSEGITPFKYRKLLG